MTPNIKTPRGEITIQGGRASLKFNSRFQPKYQKRYTASQRFIDSEVLRLSDRYTPKLTGMLILSGTLGTDIGSGEVKWIAPYSKAQYYTPRKVGTQTGSLRGPFWFERMKRDRGREIIRGARRIVGTGRK